MSTSRPIDLNNDESQFETQDVQGLEAQELGAHILERAETHDEESAPPPKKKREKKDHTALIHEAGKSLFPFSRVQKIIKADKDIPIIAKDATFLISLATEEFIKRLCEAAQIVAERDKRATVQHKDLATVVRKADEFLFLEEMIPWATSDPPAKRKPKAVTGIKGAPTMLDQFVMTSKGDGGDLDEQGDIIMNEDGTMYVAGGETQENGD